MAEESKTDENFFELWRLMKWIYKMVVDSWKIPNIRTLQNKCKKRETFSDCQKLLCKIIDDKQLKISAKRNFLWEDLYITAHWLTYIFDYGMRTEYIWNNLTPILLFAIYKLRMRKTKKQKLDDILNLTKKGITIKISDIKCSFRHRFMEKHRLFEKVKDTLKTLASFDYSVIVYLTFKLSKDRKSIEKKHSKKCPKL
ncbi:MAG: hypothetical protein ACTSU6_06050 [Candidatus Njordarchaeales archaeon]